MKLSNLLCEELYINEADIRNLPKHLIGLKAYEMAYNRAIAMGNVLDGNAIPLNFDVLVNNVTRPKLVRGKNTYTMQAGEYVAKADRDETDHYTSDVFKQGDVHDFIHLLTSTMLRHVTDKFVGKDKVPTGAKMNRTISRNKTYYRLFKEFEGRTFINPASFVKKYTGLSLMDAVQERPVPKGQTQYNTYQLLFRIESALEKKLGQLYPKYEKGLQPNPWDEVESSRYDMKQAVKDGEVTRELANEVINVNMVRVFIATLGGYEVSGGNSKKHYQSQTDLDQLEVGNFQGNLTTNSRKPPRSKDLPQYATEEDKGNSVAFYLLKMVGGGVTLGPFAEAIRTGKPVDETSQEQIISYVSDPSRKTFRTFDDQSVVVQRELDRLQALLEHVLPIFFKLYNTYLSRLVWMPEPKETQL